MFIPTTLMAYQYKVTFSSLTGTLSGVDLSILSLQSCSIDHIHIIGEGLVSTFLFRADESNLVMSAIQAIIDTKTKYGIEDGISIVVSLLNDNGNSVYDFEFNDPEVVGWRVGHLTYEENFAATFELDIKYNGTNTCHNLTN